MTAERTADPLGRRILRTADALIRSMKTRVFLAAFAVALVPLAGLTGWGLLLQKDQLAAERSEAAHLTPGVHAAWDTIADNQTAHAMESLATMGTRLSPAAFRALAARVAILMESSHGNYTSMRTEPAALSRAQGLLHGNAGMLARLQSQGYVWGDATYWYPDPHWDPGRLSAAWNREPSWMGEDTPFVAWMPAEGTVWYLQVTSANENPPHGVPRWWIAAVIGVMLAIIAGCAIIAMLLATRGVAKPLKRMAQASDRLAADRPVEPVPVKGPSEVRRATRAFNAMTAHLTRAQDTEQQFLLSVTHELKTPLTSIRGYGEALAEGAVSGDEAGPVVAEEAGRMQRLVQDLLDLGRAHKSTFGVRHEAVDLAQVAREAVRRLVPRAEEYRVELIAAVPDDDEVAGRSGIEAIADGDRLLQVVSNLVENAVRCAPAFSRVTVTVGTGDPARTGHDEVFVAVADSGLGLQEEELAHAFDRFYLYERYGRERPVGTGLGLAIVKELTEAMGGRVDVESRPGDGTVFRVSLPRSLGAAGGTLKGRPDGALHPEVADS